MKIMQVDWPENPRLLPTNSLATKFDLAESSAKSNQTISTSRTFRLAFLPFESYQMLTTLRLQRFPWPDPSEFYVDLVSGCFFMSLRAQNHTPLLSATIPDTAQAAHATPLLVPLPINTRLTLQHSTDLVHSLLILTSPYSEVELKGIGSKKA
jgi:hypothetical protein